LRRQTCVSAAFSGIFTKAGKKHLYSSMIW